MLYSYDTLKSVKRVNVFHFQLGNLEHKWQHHEQNNYVMKECILLQAYCSWINWKILNSYNLHNIVSNKIDFWVNFVHLEKDKRV